MSERKQKPKHVLKPHPNLWILSVLAGLVIIGASMAWQSVFSIRRNLELTEGEIRPLGFAKSDSLYLHKFRLTFYPETQSIKDYQALVVSRIGRVFSLDTISLNHPLKRGSKRISISGYGLSKDSVYLRFILMTPWADSLTYEFPPEGVIDDERFPMLISFEKFHIDRSQLWPLPEVPVVNVKIIEPGKLVAEKKMRAPDSLDFEGYRLYFDGIRFRPTATFVCTKDSSWIAGCAGLALLLFGLVTGFVVRMRKESRETRRGDA
ncbi:cytochrome c biogenesis protein ResB [bacterium]|nr:cytochrome c biogenesis protein ResB [bacterium]